MKISKTTLAILGLAAAAVAVVWFINLSLFIQESAALAPPSQMRKLDAIVVLTGGSNRLDTGFDLLEKGYGKKLFISGVYRGTEIKKLLKRWKDEPQGNLDCCVVLGFMADSTAANAIETLDWLRKENFHSLYLVTANYHIKRAMMEFRNSAPDLAITPFPVAPDRLDLKSWWKTPSACYLVMHEYMKYTAARILHLFPR